MPSALSRAITDPLLRRLASLQSYERGLDYFSHGHVTNLEEDGDCIRAVVSGTDNFRVILAVDDGVLDYSCECPAGRDSAFCEHSVAAALVWLNRTAERASPSRPRKAKEITLAKAVKILQTEDKDTLLRMLLDWAKQDRQLHEQIILYAARRAGPDVGVAAVQRAFEKAVRVHRFIAYREARDWARGVDRAIDSIEQLLNDGQAAPVIELCESALQHLLEAVQSVDDSDGNFSSLRDRLQDIHYRACEEVRPDPAELATRLFDFELHSEFDVFYGAGANYAEILGDKGMEVYRKLAEVEWKKVPARTIKDGGSEWVRHSRITHIMESLAKFAGDIEQRVAVMSRDLSSGFDYLKIAEVYREAHQYDNALSWAEKGLEAFPDRTDARLREFAAQEYQRRGRNDDAMKLMWAEFSERPYLETYKTLERHAENAGVWPEWRERALAEFRLRIAKARERALTQPRLHWMPANDDHSPLVEVFLYEGKPEEAWREAQTGGCSANLWLRLAAIREEEHPEDAAHIYLKRADAALAVIRNGRYEDAVNLLVKAAAVMKRTLSCGPLPPSDCSFGRSAEFVRHLNILRATYKNKRNFIKLTDQKRKSLCF